jgi:uncharacterized membrane protein YbhN (UPF0104 family)
MNDEPQRAAGKRGAVMVAKLAASGALLAWLLSRVDRGAMWTSIRGASLPWMGAAIGVFFANILASTWRWRLLLRAQRVRIASSTLLSSYLVATFFNNFLPSNIGGDVVRIRDTAGPARSKTIATTVVLLDRGLGLMGLVLVAALGATATAGTRGAGAPVWASWLWAGFLGGVALVTPAVLSPSGFGRLLRPLVVLHPEWIGARITTVIGALERFRDQPGALLSCFGGAVLVQALLVLYYGAVAHALDLPVGLWDLAVVVPVSFLVQMLPVSVNGFGVREATFSFYFAQAGLPRESAILLPLTATALIMLFSLSGGALYVSGNARRSGAIDQDPELGSA